MKKLTIYKTVLRLLRNDVKYRNSDTKLIWRIWSDEGFAKKDPVTEEWSISFHAYGKASREQSIRRARREAQEKNPELQASKEVQQARSEKESLHGNFIHTETVQGDLDLDLPVENQSKRVNEHEGL